MNTGLDRRDVIFERSAQCKRQDKLVGSEDFASTVPVVDKSLCCQLLGVVTSENLKNGLCVSKGFHHHVQIPFIA